MKNFTALSLFANVGIAETYLEEAGVKVAVANEFLKERAKFYREMHPTTDMICGDITDQKVQEQILASSREHGVNLVIATPPCQGMSSAGKRNPYDERNTLVCPAVEIIRELDPEYVLMENVPEIFKTYIVYQGKEMLVTEYLEEVLCSRYTMQAKTVNAADFGVPQSRRRAIFLLSRKDVTPWQFPDTKGAHHVTMEEAIGWLPSVDPIIRDADEATRKAFFPDFEKKKEAALKVSPYHRPPKHPLRQIIAMSHTPEGKTALHNEDQFRPKKKDGTNARAHLTSYKRQEWGKPAMTVTMSNGSISSQNNVHPGRLAGTDKDGYPVYSEPRVLTLLELFLVSSLPFNWNPPAWASDCLIRKVIGEGVPPLMMKKLVQALPQA